MGSASVLGLYQMALPGCTLFHYNSVGQWRFPEDEVELILRHVEQTATLLAICN